MAVGIYITTPYATNYESINKPKPVVFYTVAMTGVTKQAGNYVTGDALIALISGTGTSILGKSRNRTDSKSDKTPAL